MEARELQSWFRGQLRMAYNAAQMGARYDAKLRTIDQTISSAKCQPDIIKLLSEYETLSDLPPTMASGAKREAALKARLAVNSALRSILEAKEPQPQAATPSALTAFDECHLKGDLGKLKSYLHSRMDGKKDVEAFKYIHAAVLARYISQPQVTVVRQEFNVTGDKTTYNDYVGFLGKFTTMPKHRGSIEAITSELHELLDENSE